MKKLLIIVLALAFVSFAFAADDTAIKQAIQAHQNGIELTKAQDALMSDWETPPVILNTGGPDAFGYIWKDSEEGDGPVYSWWDISATGTSVIGDMSDDNVGGPYPIGFAFPFYGATYNQVWIGSNGAINFNGEYIGLSNYQLPSASSAANIAIFHDDMDPADSPDADLLYEVVNDGNQDIFVISCLNWDEYPGNADPAGQESVTMQYLLYADGTIVLQYQTVEAGIDIAGCTIGIQNLTRDIGLTALYNGSIAGYPYAELAIEFSNTAVPDASIEGFVTDSVTGDPIAGADVDISGTIVTTDGTGYYFADGFFPLTVQVSATAAGYFAYGPTPVDLVSGLNTFDFMMDPAPDMTFFTDFEAGPEPFVTEDVAWEFGTPTSLPNGAYSGANAWATYLAGAYTNGGDDWLMAGPIYVDDPNAYMSYYHFLDYETGWDGYNVQISVDDGATWNVLTPIGGYPGASIVGLGGQPGFTEAPNVWEMVEVPFGDYVGEAVWIAFRHGTDGSVTYSGVAIDDFTLYGAGYTPPPVEFELIPVQTVIPETGGTLEYDVSLVSNIGLLAPGLRYQTFVTLPNGGEYGPINNIPWTLTPFMDVYIPGPPVAVPGWAPQGAYMFHARAGVMGNPDQQVTDEFSFIKQGAGWTEDFEDGQAQSMEFFVGDMGSYMIDAGYAKFNMVSETDEWGSGAYTGDIYANFSASSTHEFVVTAGNSVGMGWCLNGPYDADMSGYTVYLSNGSYSCWNYSSGVPANLIGWTANGAIQQGVGAINTIQVDGSGGTFDITINGTYITSFTDATHPDGYIGIITCYTNETWFDEVSAFHGAQPRVAIDPPVQGELETVLRDHRGVVITDPADFYTPGNAGFDRSAEFTAEPFDFDVNDWRIDDAGFLAGEEASVVELPNEYQMTAAYPNPFNPTTTVRVALPSAADLNLAVYNINGQLVATLNNGTVEAGTHSFVFDAANLSSGIYFVKANVPGELNQVQKVMLVR